MLRVVAYLIHTYQTELVWTLLIFFLLCFAFLPIELRRR